MSKRVSGLETPKSNFHKFNDDENINIFDQNAPIDNSVESLLN